jgi:hypothetical protein
MAEIPRSWFSNPRPLPLDKDGRVDFSLDTENQETIRYETEMPTQSEERFMGRKFDEVKLPDGGRVILLYRWDENDPDLPLHDSNHNIFRLDKDGKVVWQVVRDEQGKVNWESCFSLAREKGKEHYARRPFMALSKEGFIRPGKFDSNNPTNMDEADISAEYKKGFVLRAVSESMDYEVDVETGIAKNTTPRNWRKW